MSSETDWMFTVVLTESKWLWDLSPPPRGKFLHLFSASKLQTYFSLAPLSSIVSYFSTFYLSPEKNLDFRIDIENENAQGSYKA